MIIRIVPVITETGSGRSVMASLTLHHYEDSTISAEDRRDFGQDFI